MTSDESLLHLASRIRATGAELVFGAFEKLLALCFALKEIHQNRKALGRFARKLPRLLLSVFIGLIGLSAAFVGGLVLCVVPIAFVLFAYSAPIGAASQIVPFSIGVSIALAIYTIGGLLLFGFGLWIMAPKSRAGKFGRRLVMQHILRRRSVKDRPLGFAGRSTFGLFHRRIPATLS